jgi:tetratricopeptide (TPR) repeat protein
LLELRGLREQEVEELAAKILQTAGVDRAKLSSEYLELLKLLGGHPFSLRVVLPNLKKQSPQQVIDDWRQGRDTFQGAAEEGRDKSLTVSLDYSFAKLSERARRHLPFLALFSERVNVHWLDNFSAFDINCRQTYQAIFGENLQKPDWLSILNEATEAGILEYLGQDVYKIHPALPWYLRQRLAARYSRAVIHALEKKLLTLYAGIANTFCKALVSKAQIVTALLLIEEPNLLQNLRLAEQQKDWNNAQLILQALGTVYERQSRRAEFRTLRQRAFNQIGKSLAEAKEKGQSTFNFWMYLRGVDAAEAGQSGELEKVDEFCREILNELVAIDEPTVNSHIASSYQNLANVATEEQNFKQAYNYLIEALKIRKEAKDLYEIANIYFQLGNVAREQRDFEEAIKNYEKAIQIFKEDQDFHSAARGYHNLGVIAQEKQNFKVAINNYKKAVQIFEEAQDSDSAASTYFQMGRVAGEQQDFEIAINYYRKALKIREDAEDFYQAAGIYHSLGLIAREQQHFEEAINYHKKAFEIFQQHQNWRKVSATLTQWSITLTAQEHWTEALKIYIQALVIDLKYSQDWVASDIKAVGLILKEQGESQFEAVWQEVTGEECPEELRLAIQAASEENEE